MRRRHLALRLAPVILAIGLAGPLPTAHAAWNSVEKPIDPTQLTSLPFGTRSYWMAPWRSYLTTPPATTLRDGMGVHLNVAYNAQETRVVAPLLGASGIRRARFELSWTRIDVDDPSKFATEPVIRSIIGSLKSAGIRPLILLNANSGAPGPTRFWTAQLTSTAPAGARTVRLDAASAARVVAGLSGLNQLRQAAGVLFTSVAPDGTATLSRPLPEALAAGPQPAATLKYEPFARPLLADGSPNPRFERTLSAWLSYVGVTTRLVRDIIGSDAFDVEIWNELSNGSYFLNEGEYYAELPDPTVKGEVVPTLLRRTIEYLRDPANGVAGIGIGNGFSNQTPFPAGSTSPVGLTALDKHTYANRYVYPHSAAIDSIRPLDALAGTAGTPLTQPDGKIFWQDKFTPDFIAHFPEWWLTGMKTESLIRDLAPMTTKINGVDHGRYTAPVGGTPPQVWITETNIDPTGAPGLSTSDYDRIHAKTALRTYVSYINKGVSMVQLYGVKDAPNLNVVSPQFFEAAAANGWQYPGAATAGPTMAATGRLAATVADARPISSPRALRLERISDESNRYQFLGDGTAAHPTLYDRDVLAFMPFQLSANRFVAGVYVMTRDLTKVYDANMPVGDPRRTDLPPETFRVQVGGVDATNLTASATDPLTGAVVPVTIVARNADSAILEMKATDSPRMLLMDDSNRSAGTAPAPKPPVVHGAVAQRAESFGVDVKVVRRGTARRAALVRVTCSQECRISWRPTGARVSAGRLKGSRTLGPSSPRSIALSLGASARPKTVRMRFKVLDRTRRLTRTVTRSVKFSRG